MSEGIRPGSVVYVRYRDHVLFRDVDPCLYKPFVRETIGWLDHKDDSCIRILWERYAEPRPAEDAKLRATGLTILRSAILEMKRVV